MRTTGTRLARLITLVAALGMAAAGAAAGNDDSVAVIIGNKTYKGGIPPVEFAHNDAAAMRKYVVEVLGYREGNVIDLRDATKAELEATFGNHASHKGKLFNWVRPGESEVVVFYSGHGVPGQKDGRGYLVPSDAVADLIELGGYPLDMLVDNLGKVPAKTITVFLDACFSGLSERGPLVNYVSSVGLRPAAVEIPPKLTVVTAASGQQMASWDVEARHGLFTRHLLKALHGEADTEKYGDGDGKVTLGEVKTYLDREMSYWARRSFNREQTADVHGDAELVLAAVPKPAKVEPPKPAAQPVAVAPAAPVMPPGPSREQVAEAQRLLADLGFDPGPADGAAGGRTVAAVRGFQARAGLGEDGAITDGLVAELRKARAAALRPAPVPEAPKPAAQPAVGLAFPPGKVFRDCAECPEMVVVPAGSFTMGSSAAETTREGVSDEFAKLERPQHAVRIPRAFALGKHHVTRGEFAAFVRETGHASSGRGWRDPGFAQTGDHPVVYVSHGDAEAYVAWLSRKAGAAYRLPSEAEWEYAARAGTGTARFWGDGREAACEHANGADLTAAAALNWKKGDDIFHCRDGHAYTAPVGSFRPNGFGLSDVLGNALQWTADCWNDSHAGAPGDGSARATGDCGRRVLRGGSWDRSPRLLRSADRDGLGTGHRFNDLGFRVARTLP